MKKIALIQFISLLMMVFGLTPHFANALSTRDRILNDISVSTDDQYSVIKITFNFPVRYVRHYPLGSGKEVRIQLEPISVSREDREGIKDRESLFPPRNNLAGVARVEYEGSDFVDPTLTVVFEKPTAYQARQGEDFRSLVILVPVQKDPAKQAEKPVKEKTIIPGKTTAAPDDKTDKAAPMTLSLERQASLLKEGNEVMAAKNFPRAIQVYTKLLESTDQEVLENAQFQLALAREYNGHLAHAKAELRNYLTDYPDGPNVEEARNRLKALMSARPLGATSTLASSRSLWESSFYGSVSQVYDRDESFSNENTDDETTINTSSLTTGFDGTWRLKSDDYQLETVVTGSQEFALEDDQDNETRVSALYIDFEDSDRTITSRWGRQSGNSGGVLGRFDGGRFGYLLSSKVRMNLVAGFPVNLSSDGLESDKYFYGINFDLGRFWDHWDFNLYFINQVADGEDDRRAIGGEIRYLGNRGSFFSLIDYDILYHDVNIALFAGNYLLPNDKTRLNFSADFRKSPILSTSNGLIGQLSPSLSALEDSIGEDALRQLVEDRTLNSSFVTLGASHPLTENFQIAGDISWSKLDGAPASGGVEAIESTGDEFFYSLQLIGSNLIKQGDIAIIGLRYADTKQLDTYTLDLNTRYPLTDVWRLNPRLQIDYRENKELPGDQVRFRPSMRIEYMLREKLRLELETGISYVTDQLPGVAEDDFGYFISAGIRWDF